MRPRGGRIASCVVLATVAMVVVTGARPASSSVEVQARVERRVLAAGETTTLEVVVRGASGNISEPELNVPQGVDVLSSGRMQNFSWVNGRSNSETVFRYEIAPTGAGRYTVGPIHVRVGGQIYESPAIDLTVSAAPTPVGNAGSGPASLIAEVTPARPYVGQPLLLRVRLIQRSPLAEDPQYTPPATPGFWSERFSEPESYYAAQGPQRVLVTETRARLYALAVGDATVGEAVASVALATPGPVLDPFGWLGGRVPRRELTLKSPPVRVQVRELPAGAPPGFDGAVGSFTVAFTADRTRTSQDVPVTVRLEVRGVGNLPLLHTPALTPRDFEPFTGAVEDSLGAPGSLASGRRRFQWTLLPRRQGDLTIEAPSFAWFDPATAAYGRVSLRPLVVSVGPPLYSGEAASELFPTMFADHPLDPTARPVAPWAWAVSGLALGASLTLWRRSRRVPADAADRARQREWLRAVGLARGPDFWQASEQASAWLEARGRPISGLRREISAARYARAGADEEAVRRRLVAELGDALPRAIPTWPQRASALVLAAAAIVLAVMLGPGPGGIRERVEAGGADAAARAGDLERARRVWLALWERGARTPGLAARLAWAEVRGGQVGPASAWVVRGEILGPRDPALGWVRERVREAGGLSGATSARWPVRRIEWSVLALVFGAAAGGFWPRRVPSVAALALAVTCAAVFPFQGWVAARIPAAVLEGAATLAGPGLELEPGQVVRILSRAGDRVRVEAGRGIEGWLPASGLIRVDAS